MTKTVDQILARIAERKPHDFMGFEIGDYVNRLPFEQAKAFLKPEVTTDQWKVIDQPPLEELKAYMEFAWDKANNQRGLSASRSISHCRAWLWLAGLDDLAAQLEDHYQFYGKPCLVIVCELVGYDWRQQDDGIWDNDEGGTGISAGRKEGLIAGMVTIAEHYKKTMG